MQKNARLHQRGRAGRAADLRGHVVVAAARALDAVRRAGVSGLAVGAGDQARLPRRAALLALFDLAHGSRIHAGRLFSRRSGNRGGRGSEDGGCADRALERRRGAGPGRGGRRPRRPASRHGAPRRAEARPRGRQRESRGTGSRARRRSPPASATRTSSSSSSTGPRSEASPTWSTSTSRATRSRRSPRRSTSCRSSGSAPISSTRSATPTTRGVVHCDVTPGNVLIDPSGAAKLIDFGLAKAREDSRDQRLTGEVIVSGTPGYLSPEQARGVGSPGPSSDLFGCGAVLFRVLTGYAPYGGDTAVEVVERTLTSAPLPLRPRTGAARAGEARGGRAEAPLARPRAPLSLRRARAAGVDEGGRGHDADRRRLAPLHPALAGPPVARDDLRRDPRHAARDPRAGLLHDAGDPGRGAGSAALPEPLLAHAPRAPRDRGSRHRGALAAADRERRDRRGGGHRQVRSDGERARRAARAGRARLLRARSTRRSLRALRGPRRRHARRDRGAAAPAAAARRGGAPRPDRGRGRGGRGVGARRADRRPRRDRGRRARAAPPRWRRSKSATRSSKRTGAPS